MSCNNQPAITETIICAKTCTVKLNDNPIAKLSYSGTTLSDDSTYFDGGVTSNRLIRWKVYVDNYFFYDFGWNIQTDIVPELANGSTYNQMNLGVGNITLLLYFESLANTIVPYGTRFEITVDVKDSTGVENINESNKFKLTK